MYRHAICFTGVLVAAVLIAGIHSSLLSGMARRIPNVPCTERDLTNMFGRCMMLFSRGHGLPTIMKMRKSLQCDTSMLNCTSVMQTRLCLAGLSHTELSPACRPFINRVSDYQLGVFNIPCRVEHLKAKCMDFFHQHGLTHF